MHTKLQNAQVYSCEKIETQLMVGDKLATTTSKGSTTSVIIRNKEDVLEIFLPAKYHDQSLCLCSKLPKALVTELQIESNGADNYIRSLLNDPNLGTDQIIEEEEEIPHCNGWLERTERSAARLPVLPSVSISQIPPTSPKSQRVHSPEGDLESDDAGVTTPQYGSPLTSSTRPSTASSDLISIKQFEITATASQTIITIGRSQTLQSQHVPIRQQYILLLYQQRLITFETHLNIHEFLSMFDLKLPV